MAAAKEMSSGLLGRTVGQTLEDLSGGQLPAGGGVCAGLAGALGAALTCMVARGTRSGWADAGGAIAQAEALRTRLCALTVSDTEVYLHARRLLLDAECRGAPSEAMTPEQTASSERRDHDLAGALESAALVPLAIAETAADVASLAAWTAEDCGRDQCIDAAVASIVAEAAACAAAQLVLVNLAVEGDRELATRARDAARAAGESRARALAVVP